MRLPMVMVEESGLIFEMIVFDSETYVYRNRNKYKIAHTIYKQT
jgi:hypothetical protein